MFGYIFVDFCDNFEVGDATDLEAAFGIIDSVTNVRAVFALMPSILCLFWRFVHWVNPYKEWDVATCSAGGEWHRVCARGEASQFE